jgi:hypothetical protein
VIRGRRGENLYARCGRLAHFVREVTMKSELSLEHWKRVSRLLDFILAQKKEPGMLSIKEELPKPKRKPKNPKEEQAEQLRLF